MDRGADERVGARHYGLDWLRIAAFGLLIFYHIGMFFAPGVWLVKAPHVIEAAAWPMLAVQPWRMPLLFAVSGYASRALLGKTGDTTAFLRARSMRLLVPFAFALLLLIPPQTWIGLTGRGYGGSLLQFWTSDWFRFSRVEGVFLPSVEHLWFVAYLWTYTMALGAALLLMPRSWKAAASRIAPWLGGGRRLLWAPLFPLLVLRLALLFTVPEAHGVLHDWVSDLVYVPAFLFGFALADTPGLWAAIRRCRVPALLLSLSACLVLIGIEARLPDGVVPRPHAVQALQRDAAVVMAWSTILFLLDWAHRHLNRDHRLRRTLSEAVFPFYLVHQTIIVAVGWWIRDSGMSAPAMFAVLVSATLGGCWLFYEIGRRIGPVRPLIGLAPHPSARRGVTRPVGRQAQPAPDGERAQAEAG